MTSQTAAVLAALMFALVACVLVVRWAVRPASSGRHRAGDVPAGVAPFAELRPEWVVPPTLRDCRSCGGLTSVLLHPPGAHTCRLGHTTITIGGHP